MATLNDGAMLKMMSEIAREIVAQAQQNASFSQEIQDSITFDPATPTPTGYEVIIKAGGRQAPQAVAFEYGSGIHRTKGTPGTYKILPKNASMLAFQWNPANPIGALMSPKVFDWIEDENTWLFLEVDHPGVAPKPFMRPAIVRKLPEIRQRLNVAIRALLLRGGATVEVIE